MRAQGGGGRLLEIWCLYTGRGIFFCNFCLPKCVSSVNGALYNKGAR